MKKLLGAAALVAAGLFAGMWFARQHAPAATAGGQQTSAAGKPLYWYDPMKPEVHFDKPGKSPFMDMELAPKYAGAGDASGIAIDPRVAQNLGVRTKPVTRGMFSQRVDAVGAVEVDQQRVFAIESRAAGWVEQLDVHAVGERVKKGARVAGVYSPDLYAAQQELVLAVKSGDEGLVKSARQRLALLGASETQVRDVVRTREAQRRLQIFAPSDGVVTELNVREGSQVAPGTPLMRIADLSTVWIIVEISEAQATGIRAGAAAQVRLAAKPGQSIDGKLDYLYPQLDSATRTLRARLVIDNTGGVLQPGMYANVSIPGDAQENVLLVPSEAVIRTGRRCVVIVAEDEGHYRPVEVEAGPEHSEQTVIIAGLEEGQQVVTSGQFLIDSEASLQGAYDRMRGDSPGDGDRAP
jgi:Cu(I)/Ag(I) efflux system membrane fusion protein